MVDSELTSEEQRIEFLKAALSSSISGLAQSTNDPLKLLEILEHKFVGIIDGQISEIAKSQCMNDIAIVLRNAKIDLGKPPEKRNFNASVVSKENVLKVDFERSESQIYAK